MSKNNQEKEKTETKRNIKDSVFTTLFADPDYTLRMYKEMHPEDTEIQKSDITTQRISPASIGGGVYSFVQ